MPVGMGGGGEPLGFREQAGPLGSNFHIPGLGEIFSFSLSPNSILC